MTNENKGQPASPKGAGKPREPEHFPPVRQDDAVEPATPPPERRSFDRARETPASTDEGLLGPRGDPAEGKP